MLKRHAGFAGFLLLVTAPMRTAAAEAPPALLPLPLVSQATSYSCGAAALLSVLYYWRAFDGTESDLYGPLETTPRDGTHPAKIVEVARRYGLQAEMRIEMTIEDLRRELAAGATVILDIQAWPSDDRRDPPWEELWEDGHYVILAGMDSSKVYAMDPSVRAGYGYLPLEELPRRWHDYEDRNGRLEIHRRLGIVIRGSRPIASYPAPLSRIE